MMEWELVTTKETPSGGWVYTQPETGAKFSTYDWTTFIQGIESHRLANGIKLSPTWKEELEDELCRLNADKWGVAFCRRFSTKRKRRRGFSFGAAMSFLNFLWAWMKQGGKYETQEEAERRAKICLTCEFNAPVSSSCGACMASILGMVSKLRGGRKTPYDQSLGQCGVCSCLNQVSVWVPVQPQLEAQTEKVREELQAIPHCWKKE